MIEPPGAIYCPLRASRESITCVRRQMQPDEGIQAEIESEDTEVERFSASENSRDRRITL